MDNYIIRWYIVYLSFFVFCGVNAKYKQTLNGNWSLKDSENEYHLNASVPGGVYTDLMNAQIIEDVFYGLNDLKTRWVSKKNWTYSRSFQVDKKIIAQYSNINLIFDGVDTFADIYLNNEAISTTDNMFVRYVYDITALLKNEDNYIEVRFKSPVNKSKELFDEQAAKYPILPYCVPNEYNGECHVNHIRKTQASFSWDWGPALPSVGIWKQAYLEGYNQAVIQDVTTLITEDKFVWNVEVVLYFETNSETKSITGDITILLHGDDNYIEECTSRNSEIIKNQKGEFVKSFLCYITKENVQRWWPNGYGEARLYDLSVTYSVASNIFDTKKIKVGYRTVQLMQDEIESGRKFYFQVNGLPVFAKGTNSIPINILSELSHNETTIRFLLQSAKDVHMNMIRVWGGGNYESDAFYDIADELGIMIWQDFMFACNMYPSDSAFLNSVKNEVRHQVKRLQHHASIILWAGNNENEAALRQNWYGTQPNFTRYHEDYKMLYVDTIKKEVMDYDTRHFLTSSPTNGIQSDQNEDYISKDPQSHFYGDVHFYDYLDDPWDSSVYPLTRFASEYGYQSLPSYFTISTATHNKEDLNLDSEFMQSREHLPQGYEKLLRLIDYQLSLPSVDSENYFRTLIYYSQIIQAMAVRKQTEFYRRWRSSFNDKGKGFTMGALYWQLNDVWVAPTWSGIDFKNNWKMLHYFAKNFFAPVIVTGDVNDNGVATIFVVSDLKYGIQDANLNLYVYKWDSLVPVKNETLEINIPPLCSTQVKSFATEKYLIIDNNNPCGEEPLKTCFIYFTVTSKNQELITPENFIFPLPLKQTQASSPNITVTNIKSLENDGEFEIEITTDKVALFVWLETNPHIHCLFSDNGFIQVTEKKIINVKTDLKLLSENLLIALQLSSVNAVDNNSSNRISNSLFLGFLMFLISTFFGEVTY